MCLEDNARLLMGVDFFFLATCVTFFLVFSFFVAASSLKLSFFTMIFLTADDGDALDDAVDPLTPVLGVPGCDLGERAFNLVDVVDGRFAAGLRSTVDNGGSLWRLEGDEAPSVDDGGLLRRLGVDEAFVLVERGRLGDLDRGVEREARAVVTAVDVFDDSFIV